MNHLSIRLRLTLLVTLAFVVAVAAAGAVARQRLETTLIDTARANAEQTLATSFFSAAVEISRGDEAEADADALAGITRFIFTDSEGVELDQEAFSAIVNEETANGLADLGFFLDGEDFSFESLEIEGIEVDGVEIDVSEFSDEELAELFETNFAEEVAGLDEFTPLTPFEPIGDRFDADTAEQIVISQRVAVGQEELTISVATPRQPLDDSLSAFTALGLTLIPLLGVGVALATWITASRVLRPVEDIRRQVEQTTVDRLGNHVPRSGNGDEIDRLAGTMNEMLDRLRIASQRQRQFVSDASHELRSPITATLATLETTSADEASERWPDIEATLTAEQRKLASLVDDLLLLATVDEAEVDPLEGTVDLDELVIAEANRPHPITVQAHVLDPHRVSGNTRLLARCLANLVENAARHASSNVDVVVMTSSAGFAMVRVDDDGPGIPEDRLESIFERFARVDDARNRREGGAGLGLSIARGIAQQHNASLRASNRAEGGARFELTFDDGASQLH